MSGYKIGLDFGTTNSIISYFTSSAEVEAFQYGGPDGRRYIPSFIGYDEEFVEIGTAARTLAANHGDVETYGNFKMRLPIPADRLPEYIRHDRTPASVTTDYLRELLVSEENPYSFCKQQGEISGLVVSVPEIWQRDLYNRGRELLKQAIAALDLPLIQLVSEPVAAAAYYTWDMQRRAKDAGDESFSGNLLVCDMGGGTFDVSLCRIYGEQKVDVLYFDGQGDRGLESAGVAFDRRCVQAAYKAKHDSTLDENDPEFLRLLREFETVKIGSHARVTRYLTNAVREPEIYGDRQIYVFAGGYSLNFAQVCEAFAPIAAGITAVIERVRTWIAERQQTIDRVFLVGGFSQFFLVRRAIASALQFATDDPRLDATFNLTHSAYAISYGACLIANDRVQPSEKYLHNLGIVVDTIDANAERQRRAIEIIKGGTRLEELSQPQFADIPPLVTFQQDAPLTLTLWVDPQGKGVLVEESLPEMVKLPSYSPEDKWRVGMRVDRSQIAYLTIEEVRGEKRVEYELGNVLAKMFPGFVLIE
ncbi:Hsp70 family protein [Oxynema aestuarii]|jgi:molecular chaperone DnaK|uniref:Hsp70 family protein n=1 Tax=Oxynema aestuarii AP17 TaxID=2064643 RepID=A0A6H1U2T0_9CYAN|nr:Hsp70 family protein [Oxynema aestuarii]QIZ73144.1 Hsp70 family protein [Oxynema aestuarii AP17]